MTQEQILSRFLRYILTSPENRVDINTDTDVSMNASVDPNTYSSSTGILNTVMDIISLDQSSLYLNPVKAIRIACTYIMTVFSKKVQFSAEYSKRFGASLLRCTRSLASDKPSARYLSELSALISLHMQHSDTITTLIISSECLLNMFSKWLRIILIAGQDTNNICTLLSLIISAPIPNVGCATIVRYRGDLIKTILECLDSDVLQVIRVELESSSRQACARINGLMEMLVTTNVMQIVKEMSLEVVLMLIALLYEMVQAGIVAQRGKHQPQNGSWIDLLAVTNASVLLSMTLVHLVDSGMKEHSMGVFSKLMEGTKSSTQELREFLLLQVMRFKACHQVVNSLNEDRILLLNTLQNRIALILADTNTL